MTSVLTKVLDVGSAMLSTAALYLDSTTVDGSVGVWRGVLMSRPGLRGAAMHCAFGTNDKECAVSFPAATISTLKRGPSAPRHGVQVRANVTSTVTGWTTRTVHPNLGPSTAVVVTGASRPSPISPRRL